MISLEQRAALSTLYMDPARHYHNLEHIKHCLRELESVKGLISDTEYEVIEAAIWFHDAIYDPRAAKGVNETQSADLMIRTHLNQTGKLLVSKMIVATAGHRAPECEQKRLIEMFLDIDLAILGQPRKAYEEYAAQIRHEYAHVAFKDYMTGRTNMLRSFLHRPTIYKTVWFQDKYEVQARDNMKAEIALIEQMQDQFSVPHPQSRL